jgi:hypothetical protein
MTGLLSPEGAVLKDPAQVEQALAALWEPMGKQAAEAEGAETTTRVCMANLVVVGQAREWNQLSQVLTDLDREYPTRTLVLLLDDPMFPGSPAGQVHASVSSVCHVPQPGRPQVCCEQIVLRSSSAGGEGADRTILPLLASDVPLLIWWTTDPAPCQDLLRRLRGLADRLVMDAGLPGFEHLHHEGKCVSRELGWFSSYRWRVLIAQLFDEVSETTIEKIDGVEVRVHGGRPTGRFDAIWTVAFLAGQLAWRPGRLVADGVYRFLSAAGEVDVSIQPDPVPGSGLGSFMIRAGEAVFECRRCREGSDEFRIVVCDDRSCQMPRSMQMSPRRRADSLAIALTGRAVDRSFDRALPVATWIAQTTAGK